jgi:hypothetical protein
MTKAKPILEKDIQKNGRDLLLLDGWRLIKTDPEQLRGMAVQEKGIADDLFIRYLSRPCKGAGCDLSTCGHEAHSKAQVLWIEWKRPRGKVAQHQRDWHLLERTHGAATLILGDDIDATFAAFKAWYFKSGLCQKIRK